MVARERPGTLAAPGREGLADRAVLLGVLCVETVERMVARGPDSRAGEGAARALRELLDKGQFGHAVDDVVERVIRADPLTHDGAARLAGLAGDWVRANHAFHDVIYRVADLPLVEQLAKSARRSFSGPAVWAPGDHSIDGLYAKNAEQHRAIRQALAAGSGEGGRALAREHVLSSFHMLEAVLEQVGGTWPQPKRATAKVSS